MILRCCKNWDYQNLAMNKWINQNNLSKQQVRLQKLVHLPQQKLLPQKRHQRQHPRALQHLREQKHHQLQRTVLYEISCV
jgi:hypothetical protein